MIAECRLSINGLSIDGLSIGVRLPACGGELQRSNPQSALGNLQSLIGSLQSPIGSRAWVS
jgi:hypothetical protein